MERKPSKNQASGKIWELGKDSKLVPCFPTVAHLEWELLQVNEDYITNFKQSLAEFWIGVARQVDLEEREIREWILEAWGFDTRVAVRRLSPILFWIVPVT